MTNEDGNSLLIKATPIRYKDKVTFDRIDLKYRIKNGNSDIFVLATLNKKKIKVEDGKKIAVKTTWYFNATYNPTHLITKSRSPCLLTQNDHALTYKAVIRTQVIGILKLFNAIDINYLTLHSLKMLK